MNHFFALLGCLLSICALGQAKIEQVTVRQDSTSVEISYELSQNTLTDTVRVLILRKRGALLQQPTLTSGGGVVSPQSQPTLRKIYWDYTKDLTRSKEVVKVVLYINQPPNLRQGIFEKKATKWVGLGLSALSAMAAVYVRTTFTQQRRELTSYRNGLYRAQNNVITQDQYADWQTRYQQLESLRKPALFNSLAGASISVGLLDVYAFWRSKNR